MRHLGQTQVNQIFRERPKAAFGFSFCDIQKWHPLLPQKSMQGILNLKPVKMNAGRNLWLGILSVFWLAHFSFPKLLQKKTMKLYWWLRSCLIQESGEQGTLLLDEWVSFGVWGYLGSSVFFFGNVISWFSIWCGGFKCRTGQSQECCSVEKFLCGFHPVPSTVLSAEWLQSSALGRSMALTWLL